MKPSADELDDIYKNIDSSDLDKCNFKCKNNHLLSMCDNMISLYFALLVGLKLNEEKIRYHLMITKTPSNTIDVDAVVDDRVFSFSRNKIVSMRCYKRHNYVFLYASGYTPSDEWKNIEYLNKD